MFTSFFPNPRLYVLSAIAWAAACMALWFLGGRELGAWLSLGGLFGASFPAELAAAATADAAQTAAVAAQREFAVTVWMYQYVLVTMAAFAAFWVWWAPGRWTRWSVIGATAIILSAWSQVQIDVMINTWFGSFYDMLQQALAKPNSVAPGDFYGSLATFALLAGVFIITAVGTDFLSSHFIFRWRTAMSEFYTANWARLRHVEGASQRVQEDTMRFAQIMERLGTSAIDSVLTLLAFIPLLWGLSVHVKELPLIGPVAQPLVWVALLWSAFGTGLLALVGIKLPGLEFRNQRVEAALRKELVFGEDQANRAQPQTVGELFGNVRQSYFTLYANYLYFNVARYSYLQASVLVPYVAMGPSVLAGGLTLGVFQQVVRAFSKVQESFQFLVRSWPTIVELLSIYKRLKAFEATLAGAELENIEREVPAAVAAVDP